MIINVIFSEFLRFATVDSPEISVKQIILTVPEGFR